jgi:drug/metabolite transporter (DMT)-like permease
VEQIAASVSRHGKLGSEQYLRAFGRRSMEQSYDIGGIGRGIGDFELGRAGRDHNLVPLLCLRFNPWFGLARRRFFITASLHPPDSLIWIGPVAAFLSSVTWSVAATAYSDLSRQYPSTAVNATRGLIGLPLTFFMALGYFGGWVGFADAAAVVQWRHFGWFVSSMFSGIGFGDVLFIAACHRLGVPSAMALASVYPIWAAVAGAVFWNQPLSIMPAVGLVATVVGTVVVILTGWQRAPGVATPRRDYVIGLALAFMTSICWAYNSYSTARGSHGIEFPIAIVLRMSIAVWICPLIGALFNRGRPTGFLPLSALRKAWWVFALEGSLGTSFYLIGLHFSSLAVGSALSALSPVISVPLAWYMGTERFSPTKTLGIIVVVLGIVFLVSGGGSSIP